MLGKTVRAPNEDAPLCIRPIRLGMGANKMASGRRPSMDTITTRCVDGAEVGVCVAVSVSVGVAVAVCVAVAVAVKVAVAVCVVVDVKVCEAVGVEVGGRKGSPAAIGIWQASRIRNRKMDGSTLPVRRYFMGRFFYLHPIT